MPSALHHEAATAICGALYKATEQMLEKEPGFDSWCEMQLAVAQNEIPRFWSDADKETIESIAARLPPVNYLRPSPSDEKWVLGVLVRVFPSTEETVADRSQAPASINGRLPKKAPRKSRRKGK